MLDSPTRTLLAGLAITLAILLLWVTLAGVDRLGFISFLLRWLHVGASILWLGMIWFVNFIQFAALTEADDATRAGIQRLIVPRVANTFRHAAHLTLATGALMLVTSGYLLDVSMFGVTVYIPPLRNLLLWGGVAGGVVMWVLVQFLIWPRLQVVLATTGVDETQRAAARATVRRYARINLLLSIPVSFVMVAAAHLY